MTIEPGKVCTLSPLVRRITAPNGGQMTGAGTNTYLVGHRDVAVIDPGPLIDSHIESILEAGAGRIRWVLVTHTHMDHSPAAQAIIAATGAQAIGCVLASINNDVLGHQDPTFTVAANVVHGQTLHCAEFSLEAIFTPGHIGNHFCYLLKEEQLLFAGDHLMEGISVVIIPPSGDLKDFMASLNLLFDYDIKAIAPAHGNLMHEPEAEIKHLIQHRLQREQKILSALVGRDPVNLDCLVVDVYNDVESSIHAIAQFSLWAHLLKLERDGSAERTLVDRRDFTKECWRLCA